MSEGMTKEEAKEFIEVKSQVEHTHEMVTDLHNTLHKNGFIKKVNKNTRFRESCETSQESKKDWWKWVIRTYVVLISSATLGVLGRLIYGYLSK